MQLWDENFYHPRIGGPAFLKQMLERGKLNNGEQLDYASGLVLGTYKGLPTVDHAGGVTDSNVYVSMSSDFLGSDFRV